MYTEKKPWWQYFPISFYKILFNKWVFNNLLPVLSYLFTMLLLTLVAVNINLQKTTFVESSITKMTGNEHTFHNTLLTCLPSKET